MKYGLILLVTLCGCASQEHFDQLKDLTIKLATVHNDLVDRVEGIEKRLPATPTPTAMQESE